MCSMEIKVATLQGQGPELSARAARLRCSLAPGGLNEAACGRAVAVGDQADARAVRQLRPP